MEQETALADAGTLPGAPGAVPMPAFLQPRNLPFGRPRREDPAPEQETEQEPAGQPIEHNWAPDGDGSASAVDVETTVGPSPASTAKPPRPLATKAQVEAAKRLVGSILMAAGGLMNKRVAVHDGDRRWLMAPGERDAIASPLARILARHSPVSVDDDNASDLADGIEAVVALIAFSIEQAQSEPGPAPVQLQAVADANGMAPDANPFAANFPAAQGF